MARKTITNTARTEAHPEWCLGGNPGAIEAQEASGQDQLVNSNVLPTKCPQADRKILEAAGIKFGEPHKGDPLFCTAVLPKGWKKRATDHTMWSELVDENGKVRATIFYKAAFYDRDAFIRLKAE